MVKKSALKILDGKRNNGKNLRIKNLLIILALFNVFFLYLNNFSPNELDKYSQTILHPQEPLNVSAVDFKELTICSQNLNRFADPNITRNKRSLKNKHLIKRFITANCDIIALQEIFVEDTEKSRIRLQTLAIQLGEKHGRQYKAIMGNKNYGNLVNGFLIRKDLYNKARILSFLDFPIPSLGQSSPMREFNRSPLLLQLPLENLHGKVRYLILINFHLKSKSRSFKDPTQTQYETQRMEMSEALVRIAKSIDKTYGDENAIIVFLGDRNNDSQSPTTKILEGQYTIEDFRNGNCRLRKNNSDAVFCKNLPKRQRERISLLQTLKEKTGLSTNTIYSFRYKKTNLLLDEFTIEKDDILLFSDAKGIPKIGALGTLGKGSDHKLIWAKISMRAL